MAGVGKGLRVPSGEVEEALNSNRLNTPEKRHVLEAVTAYEGRSASHCVRKKDNLCFQAMCSKIARIERSLEIVTKTKAPRCSIADSCGGDPIVIQKSENAECVCVQTSENKSVALQFRVHSHLIRMWAALESIADSEAKFVYVGNPHAHGVTANLVVERVVEVFHDRLHRVRKSSRVATELVTG